jgi:hypothetical protein
MFEAANQHAFEIVLASYPLGMIVAWALMRAICRTKRVSFTFQLLWYFAWLSALTVFGFFVLFTAGHARHRM